MSSWIRFLRHLNWVTLKKIIVYTAQKRLTGLAAEMAYCAMLGLFPAIIAILTAIGIFERPIESNLGVLAVRLADLVPLQVWNLLLNFTRQVKVEEGKSWFSLSFVAAIWVFSGVLSAAMNALDQIHQISPKDKRPFWQAKLIAILLTIGTFFLLIIASFLLVIGDFLLQIAIQQNWRVKFNNKFQTCKGTKSARRTAKTPRFDSIERSKIPIAVKIAIIAGNNPNMAQYAISAAKPVSLFWAV